MSTNKPVFKNREWCQECILEVSKCQCPKKAEKPAGMSSLETAVGAALYHLKQGPMTCTQMGSALWGKPHRKWQAYARPGGRILHHMKRLGLVEQYYDGRHFFLWKLTPKARRIVDGKS